MGRGACANDSCELCARARTGGRPSSQRTPLFTMVTTETVASVAADAMAAKAGSSPLKRKKGSGIQVFARFRPQNKAEIANGGIDSVVFDGDRKTLEVTSDKNTKGTYTFDRVFRPDSTQAEVYDVAARPLIEDLFRGYYATVFAYGQTGSGKTFTMEGKMGAGGGAHAGGIADEPESSDQRGVIPRAIEHIFDRINNSPEAETVEFTVSVSYVEIYMERIRDLLDGSAKSSRQKSNLQVSCCAFPFLWNLILAIIVAGT